MKLRRSLSIATVAVASTAVIGGAIALPPVLEKIEQSNLVKALEEEAAKRDTPAPEVPSDAELAEALKSEEGKKEFSKKIEKTVIQGRKHVDEREADAQEADERYVAVDENYAARKAEAERLAKEAASARQAQPAAQRTNAGVAAELYRNSGKDAAQLLVDDEAINKQARSEKYADSAAKGAQASEHKAQALENMADKAEEARLEAEATAMKLAEEKEKAAEAAKVQAAAQKKWEEETFPKLVKLYAEAKGLSLEAAEQALIAIVNEDIEEHVRKVVEARTAAVTKLEQEKDRQAKAQNPDRGKSPASVPNLSVAPVSPAPTPSTSAPAKTAKTDASKTNTATTQAPQTNTVKTPATNKLSTSSAKTSSKTSASTPAKTASAPAPTQTKKPAPPKSSPTPTPTPAKTTPPPSKPAPVVQPSASTGGGQAKAVAYAVAVTQTPNAFYVLGGNGPNGFDCSGLVQQAFAAGGKQISGRTAQAQFNNAPTKIPLNVKNLRPGDLVFWGSEGNLWHVAIYIGNGKVAHARNPQAGITITDVYYSYTAPYPGAVRY